MPGFLIEGLSASRVLEVAATATSLPLARQIAGLLIPHHVYVEIRDEVGELVPPYELKPGMLEAFEAGRTSFRFETEDEASAAIPALVNQTGWHWRMFFDPSMRGESTGPWVVRGEDNTVPEL